MLLLHDTKPATVLALPVILRELKSRGYRIVHVEPATVDRVKTATLPAQWLALLICVNPGPGQVRCGTYSPSSVIRRDARSRRRSGNRSAHAPYQAPFRGTARRSSTAWVQELMLGGDYGLGPAR